MIKMNANNPFQLFLISKRGNLMSLKHLLLYLLIVLTAAGCSLSAPTEIAPTSTKAPTVTSLPTFTPPPPTHTATVTVTLPPTATFTPTLKPFAPYDAPVTVENVNMRSNPGYLFSVIKKVAKGTTFQVLGKAPGGEWISVQSQDKVKGWIFAQLLTLDKEMMVSAPIIQPSGVNLVKGRVVDAQGIPISGLQFTLTQGTGYGAPRNDAVTDNLGEFYAFMPSSVSGTWEITYTAISCTSNVMDANCTCKPGMCGNITPPSQAIKLPTSDILTFTLK
jgi:uncharacterized protein YgiM (DUF1202 family)